MKSRTIDLQGPVHMADFGGQGDPMLMLHGLGASHTSWMPVGPALAQRYRVVAPDLLGFGRTAPSGRAPTLESNVAMLSRLLDREFPSGPVTLVGNSMGGLVSVLLAHARPDRVRRLVLVAPALPRPNHAPFDPLVAALFTIYLLPIFGEFSMRRRVAQRGPERVLRDTLRLCGVEPERVMPEAWQASVSLAHERAAWPWTVDAYLAAARSIVRTLLRRERVYNIIRGLRTPALVTQGTLDRLVPYVVSETAVKLRHDWTLARMEGIGHVPQMEVPEQWLSLVTDWLDRDT